MHQSFCSFLCCWSANARFNGDCSADQYDRLVDLLPSYRPQCSVAEFAGGKLYLSLPDHNALHRWKVASNQDHVCLVQGDFYAACDLGGVVQSVNEDRVDLTALSGAVAGLNGVFSGFLLNTRNGDCHCFSDRYGFSRIFVARENDATIISSSLWPLRECEELRRQLNLEAIHETLMFGFPLVGDTVYKCISLPRAGMILSDVNGKLSTTRYFDFQRKARKRSTGEFLDEFRDIAKSHCESVREADPNFKPGIALSGGKDSRVALSGLLENDVRPYCFVGFDRKRCWDSERGAKVGEIANCPYEVIDYGERIDEDFHDSNVFINGGRTGVWTMNLARAAVEHGCSALYYGTSGDVISGGWAAAPRRFPSIDALSDFSINDYVEYDMPVKEIAKTLAKRTFKDVRDRFRSGYLDDLEDDLCNVALAFRIMTRNFRRIRTFMYGSSIYATPVHFFHDTRVSDFYWSLPYDQLVNQKAQSALCSLHMKELGKVSATSYPFGVALEPLFVPLAKLFMPKVLKSTLRKVVRGKNKVRRKVRPEVMEQILDSARSFELHADRFREFVDAESNSPLIEQRIMIVNTQVDPSGLLAKSRLIGPKELVCDVEIDQLDQ